MFQNLFVSKYAECQEFLRWDSDVKDSSLPKTMMTFRGRRLCLGGSIAREQKIGVYLFANSVSQGLAGCSAFGQLIIVYLHWVGYWSKPWHLLNPKIAGKWMFIPLELIIIGFDPPPVPNRLITNQEGRLFDHPTDGHVGCNSPRLEDDRYDRELLSRSRSSPGLSDQKLQEKHIKQHLSIHIIYILYNYIYMI